MNKVDLAAMRAFAEHANGFPIMPEWIRQIPNLLDRLSAAEAALADVPPVLSHGSDFQRWAATHDAAIKSARQEGRSA